MQRKIAVIMGSDSDFETMRVMIPVFQDNGIDYEFRVLSAHRTPVIATEFARNAKSEGYDLIIAGAGMSAHLPGVLAAFTGVPVIGVPIKSEASGMDGMDALHSIIQMPPGIPVATVGIDNAPGAAKLAVKMINCFRKTENDHARPIVKIIHNQSEVSEANLKKATDILDIYGISHIVADLTGIVPSGIAGPDTPALDAAYTGQVTDALNACESDSTFAFLNLTGIDIEKITTSDACAREIPLIEVPLKAASNEFNQTSDKIYYQTGRAESAAFVGVNSFQNAAHLIARIAGIHDAAKYDGVIDEHANLAAAVIEKDARIRGEINAGKLK